MTDGNAGRGRDPYASLIDFYGSRGYRYRIGPGSSPALIVVDSRYAFTSSHDGFPGGDFAEEIAATRMLLERMRGRFPTIFTTIAYEDPARDAGLWIKKVPWLECCQSGSHAVEIDSSLTPQAKDVLLVKTSPSSFFGTDLDERLRQRGVDTLIIAGCTTSVCVRATAVDAMQHGYRPVVTREAVGDFNPYLHEANLLDLDSRYADVMAVGEISTYLEER